MIKTRPIIRTLQYSVDCTNKNYMLLFVCLFVCSGLMSLSTLPVISRRCLVVTGSSMLIFIVLPHCGIRSQTLLPDTTSSHIILTPERPVLVRVPSEEQLVPLLTTLVCGGPGSNPVPPDLGALHAFEHYTLNGIIKPTKIGAFSKLFRNLRYAFKKILPNFYIIFQFLQSFTFSAIPWIKYQSSAFSHTGVNIPLTAMFYYRLSPLTGIQVKFNVSRFEVTE